MKILLVSDSHRDVKYLYEVVEKENPNIIMYAGDHSSDAYDLNLAFDIPVYIVRGNCDYDDYTGIDIEETKGTSLGTSFTEFLVPCLFSLTLPLSLPLGAGGVSV